MKFETESERVAFNQGLVWATSYLTNKRLNEHDHEHVYICQDCGDVK